VSDFFIKGPNGAVVLFEGCGGSTAGLHAAGYATVGFEYWQPAVTCAQANGFDARQHDLSDPTLDHLVPYAPLWWASPPCQPFSAAGQGEGEFDDRDGFPWLLRLVALRLPEVLIVENVKGLTFRKHSAYLCAVLEGFRALGYEVDWKVLMAADYGVPQTRERCIIICRRDGGPITWPAPTHCETGGMFTDKWVSIGRALNTTATLRPFWSEHVGHPDRRHDEPAPTVALNATDWRWIETDGSERRCTIEELARFQDFPSDWQWTGTKAQQARMIGNAVPATLANEVARVNRPHVLERAA